MKRFLAVVFWSVIAAAFIGPGTVTTCAAAGASFGSTLLWALVFSTFACYVLQEASARLTVVSGRTLGRSLRMRWAGGVAGPLVLLVAVGAIVFGCAAYEAGNILGAAAGAGLVTGAAPAAVALVCGALAGGLLWFGSTRLVARVMSVLVAVMGVGFLVTAFVLRPEVAGLLRGAVLPALPPGSGLLVIGLVGTTVVPYNLFLGSGLAAGQDLAEVRFGLAVAIGLGGLISMAILVVGTAVSGTFGFAALAGVLAARLGPWAAPLFAAGLFAAGLSSAITAPLAAAVTARSLFGDDRAAGRWDEGSRRYRSVWLAVLAVGVVFGCTGIRPIPAIILAQALNGVVLPLAAVFLLLVVNDPALMGAGRINGAASNVAMVVVTGVTVMLGAANVARAAAAAAAWPPPGEGTVTVLAAATAAVIAVPVARSVVRRRAGGAKGA